MRELKWLLLYFFIVKQLAEVSVISKNYIRLSGYRDLMASIQNQDFFHLLLKHAFSGFEFDDVGQHIRLVLLLNA